MRGVCAGGEGGVGVGEESISQLMGHSSPEYQWSDPQPTY